MRRTGAEKLSKLTKLSRWRYAIIVPVAVLVLAIVLGPVLIRTSPFLGVRQQIAAAMLADMFERDVQVQGDVDIALGSIVVMRIDGAKIGSRIDYASGFNEYVDHVELAFGLMNAITGEFKTSSFTMEGLNLEVGAAAKGRSSTGEDEFRRARLKALAETPVRFLTNPVARNMMLKDLSIMFRDADAGWNEKLVVAEASSRVSTDDRRILLEGRGAVNDVPMSLVGSFPDPQAGGNASGTFMVGLEVAGASSTVAGQIDLSGEIATIDADFDGAASLVSKLFEMFGIEAEFEGRSSTKAKLAGPLDKIGASEIAFALDIADGYEIDIRGRIDNLTEMQGLNLEVEGTAPEKPPVRPEDATFLDLDVTGFRGVVAGNVGSVNLDQLIIFSTSASAEFNNIGPISVTRVVKTGDGELSVEGIHVLNGPPERRTLDLKGSVRDVLSLDGITLGGSFDLPAASALSLEGAGAEAALGRLAGKMVLKGANGDFALESFEAQVQGSDLLQLTLRHVDKGESQLDEVAVNAELEISDLTSFAAALDQTIDKVGSVAFDGEISVSEIAPSILGVLRIDKTQMDVELRGSLDKGAPRLNGSVTSKRLHLDDLRGFVDVLRIGSKQDVDRIDIDDKFVDALRARIDIDFARIAGGGTGGKSAGQISGIVDYQDGVIALDPLKMRYLNGTITAKSRTDTRKAPLSHRVEGKLSRIRIGSLLNQLRAPRLFSGSLNLSYKLTLRGEDFAKALKTASGSVSGSVWGGTVETGLLDLTGLNLITWLGTSSKAAGRAKIVCAVMPFQFKNGRGATRSMIIETDYVQALGAGSVDFAKNRINISFQPRPKVKQVVDTVSPFTVVGPLNRPNIKLNKGGKVGRAVGETLTLPLNVLGALFIGKQKKSPKHKPCVVQRKAPPKKKKR